MGEHKLFESNNVVFAYQLIYIEVKGRKEHILYKNSKYTYIGYSASIQQLDKVLS